jgi:hypothetical protein
MEKECNHITYMDRLVKGFFFLLFDLEHVYVQVDVIMTHIFFWFYI